MLNAVALVEDNGDVAHTLAHAIQLVGGFGDLQSPIIIKPNICTEADRVGFANTQVDLVEALIKRVLQENGHLSIKIVESDSMSKSCRDAFERYGYQRLVDRLTRTGFDVSLVCLTQSPMVTQTLNGLYFTTLALPQLLCEPNYFISIAVAKTHGLTDITGSLKNLFGLLPRKEKMVYHPHIHEVIVDVNRLIKSNLAIIDARVGLEGWAGSRTRRLNTLIVGQNPVSVDATMARVMGFDPAQIQHLTMAEQYGLGTLNPIVVGTSLSSTTIKFAHPHRYSGSNRPT